ncbi:MAG: hypothetical protein JWP63_636, partial [Candidatus Solibacter sp.]|nr:hypothetical protein [Candidatus Solibacter sp.]
MKAPGICLLVVCLAAAQSKDWAGLTRYGSDNAELRPPK